MSHHKQPANKTADQSDNGWVALVRQRLDSLKFGEVRIVVHNSRVVQIESMEKVRLDQPPRPPAHATGPHYDVSL